LVPDHRTADALRLAGLSLPAVRAALLILPGLLAAGCGSTAQPPPAAAPARIVTLAPHLAELVHAAGAGDLLVGTVEFSDYPPAVLALPRVGDAFRVDLEALAALRPDLVLYWPSGNARELPGRLAQLGFSTVGLEPEGLDSIAGQILAIGELAGTTATAREAAAAVTGELAGLRAAHAKADPVRVFYQVAARPLLTVNGRHIISDAITSCGGINVFASLPELTPAVSLEAVLAESPGAIVTTWYPVPGQAPPRAAALLADWLRWPSLPAVGAGNLVAINADLLSRPTPRMLEGVAELCAGLERARAGAGSGPG